MRRLLLLVLLVCLPLSTALANITVPGSAAGVLTPDLTVITATVTGTHPSSLPAATASAAAVIATARAALTKAGLPADDWQEHPGATVYASTEADGPGTASPPAGTWTVKRPVVVTLRGAAPTLAEVVSAWSAAGHRGGITIVSVVSDPVAGTDALRKRALADARRRADLIASAEGQTVGALLTAVESPTITAADGRVTVGYTVTYTHK